MLEVFSPSRKGHPGLALVTEKDFEEVLISLFAQAKKNIDLMAFSFVTGDPVTGILYYKSSTFKIMQELKRIKKEYGKKIRIRVFLEGHRQTADKNKFTALHLEKAGIEVRLGATHAKCCSVDQRYLLIGSTNLTDQSLHKNLETNVLVDQAKVAREFGKYFQHYWEGGLHGDVVLKKPLLADGAFKHTLLKRIARSRTSLFFSMYFFDQKEIESALLAAHKRGVKITGIIHDHASFGMVDVLRTRATVKRLRAGGLKAIRFSSPRFFTHSKYIIFDEKELVLGTGNWLDRDVTTHPQLHIDLVEPKLCKTLCHHLIEQMEEWCRDS